jgi:anti-sigma B factor antagonist
MSGPVSQRLEVEDIGHVTVVRFTDRKILDEPTARAIGEQLAGLVDDRGRAKLLLDFGEVEYLCSAVLGQLVALNEKVQATGGKLILCNLDPTLCEVFELTGLSKLLDMRRRPIRQEWLAVAGVKSPILARVLFIVIPALAVGIVVAIVVTLMHLP